MSGVRAVFFDVGETLVNETRAWERWARHLGVPTFTFFGVVGGVIERGEHHNRAFEIVRPDLDLASEREKVWKRYPVFDEHDLYPDAVPCLEQLRTEGYFVGLVGNMPATAEHALEKMHLPVHVVASSASWEVEKPSPAFFSKVEETAGCPASEIAYVGDRLDNDVLPALEAGMTAVFLRRGPWGYLHAERPEVARATIRVDGLADLPPALRALGA